MALAQRNIIGTKLPTARGYVELLVLFSVFLLFAGAPSAALLPDEKPGWSIALLSLFALIHASAVASVALLVAAALKSSASSLRRWVVAGLWSFAVIFVAIDARLYALTSLHIGGNTFGNVLQPGAMGTLGITWTDLVLVFALFAIVAALSAWLLARPMALRRAMWTTVILVLLDAGLSLGSMVARFHGVRPLMGLDVAMPLGWAPRHDEKLSVLFGHAPMVTDDDLQFPRVAARPPQTLVATEWSTESERRPDILFVVFESLRPDALEQMPVFSRLASDSVQPMEHYAGGNCSHLGLFSLFTGLDPSYMGVDETARSPVGLGALAALGYEIRISHGASLDFQMDTRILPEGAGEVSPFRHGASGERDRENEAWAIEWARQARKKPSALVLFLERTHWPYFVDGERTRSTMGFDSWQERHDVQELKDRYLRAAVQSDETFGRVLAALEEAGRLDSTVVIATGDHGEAFREHGVLMHGSRLDEEQIRVPLAMKLPGVDARPLSLISTHQDVLPTLLSYLGTDVQTGPGTGIDLLAPTPQQRLPVVGACAVGIAIGYAAILDDVKLLYQLDGMTARYVSLTSRDDVPLGATAEAGRREAVLEDAGFRAAALLTPSRLQAQGPSR